MTAYPLDVQMLQNVGIPVRGDGRLDVDSEFVLFKSGGNVRMCFRVDVRVDPQADPRTDAHHFCASIDRLQLLNRFDIEHQYARLQGIVNLVVPLAHSGIDHLPGIYTGFQCAVELASGDDVDAAPFTSKQAQDRRVRIGFCRKTDDMGNLLKCRVKNPKVMPKCPVAV